MKFLKSLFVLGIFGLSLSCEKNESPINTEAKLLTVACTFGVGVIDTVNNTVIIKAPENTDVTQMIPQFEISKNATIYPPSGVALDYSNPVTYTITAEDNMTKNVFKVTVLKPIVKFTVYDCSNWTPTNFGLPQANSTIKVYTKAENIETEKIYDTLTTDQNAQAILYGLRTNDYYLIVTKGDKSNIVNDYVLLGRYNNQTEVDSSPDANAIVGGFRFMDRNYDARINSDDKINYQVIWSQYDLNKTSLLLINLFIAN